MTVIYSNMPANASHCTSVISAEAGISFLYDLFFEEIPACTDLDSRTQCTSEDIKKENNPPCKF